MFQGKTTHNHEVYQNDRITARTDSNSEQIPDNMNEKLSAA